VVWVSCHKQWSNIETDLCDKTGRSKSSKAEAIQIDNKLQNNENVPVLCPLLHCVLGQLHKMSLYCVLYCTAYWDSYTKCACTVSLLHCVLGQLHKMCLYCVLYCTAYWDSYTKCACTVSFIAQRNGTATQNVPVLCPLLHCVLGQLHKMCLYCVLYCTAYWDSYTNHAEQHTWCLTTKHTGISDKITTRSRLTAAESYVFLQKMLIRA